MKGFRGIYRAASLISLGAISGAGLTYFSSKSPQQLQASAIIPDSTTASGELEIISTLKPFPEPVKCISAPWNTNWDHKEPKLDDNLKKVGKVDGEKNSDVHHITTQNAPGKGLAKNEESKETKKSKSKRHIFLVRHGQYQTEVKGDENRKLTDRGREQAIKTGERLKELNIQFDKMIHSNMTRAIETADLVAKSLPDVPKSTCSMLREGPPCRPEPPSSSNWKVEDWEFFQEGPRIEAAFRKYFHRADPSQEKDSYELLVCHGNVIRYFVCRALQFPPEGWLRMSIGHCGITWITIRPNGRVSLKSLGDTGHLPPDLLTFT